MAKQDWSTRTMPIEYFDRDGVFTRRVWILQDSEHWAGPDCLAQVRTELGARRKARALAVGKRLRIDVSMLVQDRYGRPEIYMQFSAFPDGEVSDV